MKIHFVILIGFLILGCSDWELERTGFTQVITIGAIEIGSNSAFLIGDIDNIREANIVGSGFLVSSTAVDDASLRFDGLDVSDFPSAELDIISEDRAFAARAIGLSGSTEYFFRAYVKIEGEEELAYGNLDQFTTTQLDISIRSVSRASSGCPTFADVEIQVEGFGPGGSTQVGIVYTDDLSNTSPNVQNGFLLKGEDPSPAGLLTIPLPIECDRSYVLRVVLNPESELPQYGESFIFTTIEGGTWREKATFPGRVKNGKPVSFSYDGKGFVGGGNGLGNQPNQSDLWKYDIGLDNWEDLGEFDGLNLSESVNALYENKIYVTSGLAPLIHCGKTGTADLENDATDGNGNMHTWASLCGGCTGNRCVKCSGYLFEDSNGQTAIARYACHCYNSATLVYNPVENSMQVHDTRPLGSRSDIISLQIENKSFLLGGEHSQDPIKDRVGGCSQCINQCLIIRTCSSSVVEFNPGDPLDMDNFIGGGRINLAGFSIGENGYVGLGKECLPTILSDETNTSLIEGTTDIKDVSQNNSFYAFNPKAPSGSQWKEVASYPGSGNNVLAFSSGDKGYVVFKSEDGSKVLWEFDPSAGADGDWKQLGLIPNPTDKDPYYLFNIGNSPFIYFPTTISNFWMYVPELD